MIIFSLADYRRLLPAFGKNAGFRTGKYAIRRFENGTRLISLKTDVKGESCAVLGGSVPGEDLVETLLLTHTLKKEGAAGVILVIPFIPYARQDKNIVGESWGSKWLGDIFAASGVSRVVTVDIHSPEAARFPVPLTSLSPAGILSEKIKKEIGAGAVCIAPDEGAVDNCLSVNRALKNDSGIASFVKKRGRYGVKLLSLKGKVGDEVIVVDDILDTGETLVAACRKLREASVQKITVAVTHGLFNGSEWKKLFRLGVRKIYCTDSNPLARRFASPKIRVVPVAKLIADSLS